MQRFQLWYGNKCMDQKFKYQVKKRVKFQKSEMLFQSQY